jgi:hypothetical protein
MADPPIGFLRRRLTFANVISLLALFIALGGTSYAVTALPQNSVGTPQLKKNAVTSAKVKDGSLTSADFAAGTLLQGERGATGATGAQGERGATGANGSVTGFAAYWNGGSGTVPKNAATSTPIVLGNFSIDALGSIFVYVTAGVTGECSTPASNAPIAALYYKLPEAATWTAVPRSALQLINGDVFVPIHLTGLINYASLSAGTNYELSMRIVCHPAGSFILDTVTGGSYGSLNVGTG